MYCLLLPIIAVCDQPSLTFVETLIVTLWTLASLMGNNDMAVIIIPTWVSIIPQRLQYKQCRSKTSVYCDNGSPMRMYIQSYAIV